MSLSVFFNSDFLPISQGFLVSSIVKESLNNSNSSYCRHLYYYREKKGNKRTKNFCTSTYLENYEILEDKIKINGKMILNISSPDMKFMTNLYNGLLKIYEFQYKDYRLKRGKIIYSKEKIILSSPVRFKALSPIVIKTKSGYYIGPEDERYQKEFNYISNIILKNYRGYGLKNELFFQPMDMRKVVLKEEIDDFTANTGEKYYYITGYKGTFTLSGDIEDLNDLYRLGVGYRRGENAGMLEVI